jgi:hypothetical protein
MATTPKGPASSRPRGVDGSRNGRVSTTTITISRDDEDVSSTGSGFARYSPFHYASRIPAVESFLKREEADVILVAGNVLLVALEIIEWPVAALTLVVHALARSRFKALEVIAVVAEEVR